MALPAFDQLLRNDKITKRRNAVYVSRETHCKLKMILSHLTDSQVSLAAFVENIVLLAFDLYRDEINAMYHAQQKDELL